MAFEFIADRPVLDFVSTVAARGTVHEEKLRSDDDLGAWIEESGLLDRAPLIKPGDVARAQQLREAVFRLLAVLIDGGRRRTDDVTRVNQAASGQGPVLRLNRGEIHRDGDLDSVLAVLARDCLELHDHPDRELLRWCDDSSCTRPFIDRSRGQRRRWCGMRGCGDRAKAAAYRERQRQR